MYSASPCLVYHIVWFCLLWFGLIWFDLIQFYYGIVLYCIVWYGMAWMVCYDIVWVVACLMIQCGIHNSSTGYEKHLRYSPSWLPSLVTLLVAPLSQYFKKCFRMDASGCFKMLQTAPYFTWPHVLLLAVLHSNT